MVNLLPRSYNDYKNSSGMPYVTHGGLGGREFSNEVSDPLNPIEDKTNLTSKNKFLMSIKRPIFSDTAKMTIFKC